MRSRLAWASAAAGIVLVAGACTNLLGSFTVGDGVTIGCEETNGARLAITTGGALHTSEVRIAVLPGNHVRIVAPDVQPIGGVGQVVVVHAYMIDSQKVTSADLPTNAGQILALARYPTGFAVMYEALDPNQANKPFLWVAHFEDVAQTWSQPVPLVESPSQVAGGTDPRATFVATNGALDQYFVAYTYLTSSGQVVYAGPLGPGDSAKFIQVDNFTNAAGLSYTFNEPAIALHPGSPALVMMTPQSQSGPPPPNAPLKIESPGGASFDIVPQGQLNYFPQGFAASTTPTKTNVAMLVANLGTFVGGQYVGQVDNGAISTTFDPTTLTATSLSDGGPAALPALFLNGVSAHWELAQSTDEQLIMIGAPADPQQRITAKGINLGWWDGASGAARVYATGANAIMQDVSFVAAADATFVNLNQSIGTLEAAFVSDTSEPLTSQGQPPAGDLYLTAIACQPK